MKSFIKKLFTRPIRFGQSVSNFVTVLDTEKRENKKDELYSGFINSVDFYNREIEVFRGKTLRRQAETHIIPFDDVVTISRMNDGRIRMWIKVYKED